MLWSRRALLRSSAAALALRGAAGAIVAPRSARGDDGAVARTFALSVASGDPTATGAVVWTRIDPAAHVAARELVLEVASDESFRDVVAVERVPASAIGPARDWTVLVDLDGRLASDRRYAYRFRYGAVSSRTGRLRTLPLPDAATSSLRFALAACQDYTRGWFNAWDHAARQDVDYILHVGDFIYEAFMPDRTLVGRRIDLPSGAPVARDLADFRALHRAYRADPALQRALERHTLIAVWDDHDVANDRYWDAAANRLRAPDHPLDGDPEASDAMHAGGIRAWWEYLPIRARFDDAAPNPRDRLHVERSFRFGTLAELFLTDTRLRRDPHPCGERAAADRIYRMDATCPGRTADGRTMLGETQRRWLVDGLSRSDARWKLWATSVPLTPVAYGSGPGRLFLTLDTWAGYEHERRAILGELAARKVRNLVSLTGDIHTFFAARLHVDEPDPLRESPPSVGVELGTGAISAARLGDIAGPISHPDVVLPNNPQVVFWNALANGYAFVEITRDAVVYEPRCFAVDRRLEGAAADVPGTLRIVEGTSDVVTQPCDAG